MEESTSNEPEVGSWCGCLVSALLLVIKFKELTRAKLSKLQGEVYKKNDSYFLFEEILVNTLNLNN